MILTRRLAALTALAPAGFMLTAPVAGAPAPAASFAHRVAVHVDTNDPKLLNAALNNVQNLYEYYQSKGEKIDIRVVAHGPGLHMLRDDTSPVRDRLATMKQKLPGVSLAACQNTMRNMEKEEGKPIQVMAIADIVPSGVVELVSLQERGWKYLHP